MNESDFKTRNPFLVIIWSFGLFILMHAIDYLGIALASSMSGASYESIISGNFENHFTILARGLVKLLIGIPMVFLILKYLWRRKLKWLCLQSNVRLIFYGALLGVILPIVVVMILFVPGDITITSNLARIPFVDIAFVLVGYLGLTAFTGLSEEVVFRGMATREMAVHRGWIIAAIISGTYFGLIHLLSNLPGMNLLEALRIILFSIAVGFLFTAMLVRSKSLWLPIGFHMGWNFCLKAVLGTVISGQESRFGLLNTELSGSSLLTGGEFGLELSMISLALYIVVAILFLKYPWRSEFEILPSKP